MKQLILILLAIGLFYSCNKQPNYTISGVIADTTQNMIYLQKRGDGEFVNIDSAQLDKGKFKMSGVVDVPEEYYLCKDNHDRILFFLENSKIKVVADSSTLKGAEINGGEVQAVYNDYYGKYQRLYDYMITQYYKARAETDEVKKQAMEAHVDSLYEDVELFQKVFMMEHPKSPVAVYILKEIQYGRNAQELSELFQKLDTSLVRMQTYQYLAKRISDLQKVAVGQVAPDFTQNDPDGNPVIFSEVYSANKYTLVDFWASWCGPCRAENPNVVKAYQEFHSYGFGVFGVSLDSNRERWLKAIEDDGLVWKHVSDLRGWDNKVAKEYSVNSIPSNFLVNENGEIIATELSGEKLISKLEALLK